MSHIENVMLWVFSLVASFGTMIAGHIDEAVNILLAMMVIDILSGLLKGAKHKRLKSAIMHMGILKKAGILLSIVFAALLDILLNDGQPVFKTLMVWLAIGNEGLSIVENLSSIGVKIPSQIKDRLAQLEKTKDDLQKEKDGQ